MFYRDAQQLYRVRALDSFPWLIHGFGTRFSAPPANGHLATLRQIHSDICVPAEGRSGVLGQGDALLENTPGALVGVKTADCIPILLVDERRRAVAAVHAGWRGTDGQIARKAVEAMQARFSSCPADLHAAVGPGIGLCCYEVGPEVAARFGRQGTAHIDLACENQRQLLAAGLDPSRIYLAGLCTRCSGQEFHSYRRDREQAGRMLSVIGIAP